MFSRSITETVPASRLGTNACDPSHITSAGYGRSPVAWDAEGAPVPVSTTQRRSANSDVIQAWPRTAPGVNSDGPAPTFQTAPGTMRPSASRATSVESRNWLTSQPSPARMRSRGVVPASHRATTAGPVRSTTAIWPSPLRATYAVSPSALKRMPCGAAPTSMVAPILKGPGGGTDGRQAAATTARVTKIGVTPSGPARSTGAPWMGAFTLSFSPSRVRDDAHHGVSSPLAQFHYAEQNAVRPVPAAPNQRL